MTWGKEDRRGRYLHKLVGIPAIANAGLKVLDSVNRPGFRAHLLFWEGWRDAATIQGLQRFATPAPGYPPGSVKAVTRYRDAVS